ncbi:MAG: acylphosphatase [bacterium]
MKKRIILKIYGRVQLVMFRDFVQRKAKKLGLSGWVMNNSDGTVQIIAEGEIGELKKLIELCYTGSILARVDKININWQEATGQFNKFNIKY